MIMVLTTITFNAQRIHNVKREKLSWFHKLLFLAM